MDTFLANISGNSLVNAIVYLLIMGIVFGILLWIVKISPIPDPFKKVVVWVIYLVGALFLINWLLGFTGNSFIDFGGRNTSSTMPVELRETFERGY